MRLVAATLALVLAGCVSHPGPESGGEEIYLQLCARCHAPDLSGGVGPALGPGSDAVAVDDAFLFAAIAEGRGRMPSFSQTLTPDQIDLVVAYIRARQAGGR